MTEKQKIKIEAATFQRLITHLQENTEVQNIDLMLLANFCRNCLAKWMMSEAEKQGIQINYEEARERVYGMPYSEWKEKYQQPVSSEKLEAINQRQQ